MQKDSLYFFRGERERKREGKKDNSKLSLSLGKLSSIAKRFSFFSTALHEKTGREKYNYDRFKPSIKIY